LLESSKQKVQIPLPSDYKIDEFKRDLNAGIKRFASGFLKTVGMVTPRPSNPFMAQLHESEYDKLKKAISINQTVKKVDLKEGAVPGDIDILLLAAPKALADIELFSVDQFLMQGGTVIIATSPFGTSLKDNKLIAVKQSSGLEEWFKQKGVTIGETFVMDSQNASFPIPITRNAGGFSFQEIKMLDYPYFPDIREGLSKENGITASLGQLSMAWPSPIKIDEKLNEKRQITKLLLSSKKSWSSNSEDIMPRLRADGSAPFSPGSDIGQKLMGVVIEGRFNSYFKDKPPSLLVKNKKEKSELYGGVISHSSDAARLILFSSNEFIRDQSVRFLTSAQGSAYLNSYQLMANTIDWSLEDRGLLTIRSRGHFNQTLPPMTRPQQQSWEYINYGLVLLGLLMMVMIRRIALAKKRNHYKLVLNGDNT